MNKERLKTMFTLVVELNTSRGKEGKHYASLLLEQARHQAYRVAALDRHVHGQLNDTELDDYI